MAVFDGAKGWGSQWTFPKDNADYYNVTNLNDSGVGSLRYGVDNAPSTGRIITFYGTSGYIDLLSRIETKTPNLYIAGQTSPNGIALRKGNTGDFALFLVEDSNTIVRGLIFAIGSRGVDVEYNGDSLQIGSGTENVIIDHCEVYFGVDENLQLYANSSKFTFQNSIVGYGLHNSTHAYTTDPNEPSYPLGHSKGALVGLGMTQTSWYNVFMAHNHDRNIRFNGTGTQHEVHNFISYGASAFQMNIADNIGMDINITNYIDKASPDDIANRRSILLGTGNELYVNSVWNEYQTTGNNYWDAVGANSSPFSNNASTSLQVNTPFAYPLSTEPILTKNEIETEVLTKAGATNNNWFGVRQIAIDSYNNGTGQIIDEPSEIGGYPTAPTMGNEITDSDNDGIPDNQEGNYNTLFDYVNSLYEVPESPSKPTYVLDELRAFPSAKGFGSSVSGGRGGQVIKVTNLNDSGAGSLREALNTSGKRYIVFDVSGDILLNRELELGDNINLQEVLDQEDCTILGQTSPTNGITLKGGGLFIWSSNVICRYLTSRPNDPVTSYSKAFRIRNNQENYLLDGVILDHTTGSHATDENYSIGGFVSPIQNITLQSSISSTPLGDPDNGYFNKGSIIGSKTTNVSLYRNLWTHNGDRNPFIGYDGVTVEYINNIAYGFNEGTHIVFGADVDMIWNIWKASTEDPPQHWWIRHYENQINAPGATIEDSKLYHEGLIFLNGTPSVMQDFYDNNRTSRVFGNSDITEWETTQLGIEELLDDVGNSLNRDALDAQLISEYYSGTGNNNANPQYAVPTKSSFTRASGYDTIADGIPDSFAIEHGITNHNDVIVNWDFGSYAVTNNAGYTAIEMYSFWLVDEFTSLSDIDIPIIGDRLKDINIIVSRRR